MVQGDHVARIEGKLGGRQPEGSGLAPHPRFHQRAAAAPIGFFGRHRHREAVRGHPRRPYRDAPRLDGHPVVILVRARDLPLEGMRQFGLLPARQFHHLARARGHHVVGRDGCDPTAPAHGEADATLAPEGIEPEMSRQHGERGPGRFQRGDDIAVHRAGQARDVNPDIRQPRALAEVAHQRRQRDRAEPAGQPVLQTPVLAIGPEVAEFREERIGPGVPCPPGAFGNIDHAPGIFGGGRIIGRVAPEQIGRFEVGALDRVVAPAPREVREEGLRRLRILEHIRLVRAATHGRAAEFGEPDGLRLRHPCGRRSGFGLNFQFCGALVNYDMLWNPMRVEQRIGRIDRLGQRFSDIRITNLHYEDTVEADVYRALRSRISIFEKVVGGLQPILTRLPRLIEESVLSKSTAPDAKQDDALLALDNVIAAGEGSALNLDEFADEDIEVPARAAPQFPFLI